MREQTIMMLELAAFSALFMGACWSAFQMHSEMDAGLEAANRIIAEQSAAITTLEMNDDRDDVEDELTFRGSELLFMLRDVEQEKYEMSVDGVVFSKGTDPETSDLSVIQDHAIYQAHYTYGAQGEIVSIQQTKVR
ncbi:hypothetical protein [Paenibacillus dakarensis]|uniref:hypothetical protein n=1 Tax=Paenibacillus dakarensis TaxID=1527293 RepID=UPI0006D575FA|nr:hypothetical protein [Paenibacillus dakarensis]